jgi:hypothetical protein
VTTKAFVENGRADQQRDRAGRYRRTTSRRIRTMSDNPISSSESVPIHTSRLSLLADRRKLAEVPTRRRWLKHL